MRKGLTLPEVIIALGLLLIVSLTIVQLFTCGIRGLRHAKISTICAFLAQEKIEELICLPASCIKEEEGSFQGFLSKFRFRVSLKAYSKDPALRKLKFLEVKVQSPDGRIFSLFSLKRATSGRIAYVSDKERNKDIFIMNADGGEGVNVTRNPASDEEPALSPDGRQLLFVSNREKVPQIYLMAIGIIGDGNFRVREDPEKAGAPAVRLTDFPLGAHSPAWSPDGKTIAFSANERGYSQIFTMKKDGSEKRNLTGSISHETCPRFSPDGNRLIFVSSRNGDLEIYAMDTDGGEQRRLTQSRGWDVEPRYSPDGKYIAFISTRSGTPQVYVMNADGEGQKQVTEFDCRLGDPAWSLDSKDILVWADKDAPNSELYVIKLEQAEEGAISPAIERLTQTSCNNTEPSWAR